MKKTEGREAGKFMAGAVALGLISAALPYGVGVLVAALVAVMLTGAVVMVSVCLKETGRALGNGMLFGWAPSAAYLTGRKRGKR